MQGNDRTIGFSNCERYFAKGTRGIHGIYRIPNLTAETPNDFITQLFAKYNSLAKEEVKENAKANSAYEEAIVSGTNIINGIKDAAGANEALKQMADIKHALTSKKELNELFKAKVSELGLVYDKKEKAYKDKEEK